MPLTPDQMHDAVVANLPRKTGKPLEEWVALVGSNGDGRWAVRATQRRWRV